MTDINYIAGIALGKVKGWTDKKASSITPISFPGQNSGETEGIDTLGIIAFTEFDGQWTGTFANIQGYIASIKSIADGAQLSSSALKSPFVNTRTTGNILRFGSIATNTSTSTDKLIDSAALFVARGVQIDDLVKNLTTGLVAYVSSVDSETQITLKTFGDGTDLFTTTGVGYAVTTTMNCKILSIDVRWELPALSICNYKIGIMQVK